jgi:hypothetical protein
MKLTEWLAGLVICVQSCVLSCVCTLADCDAPEMRHWEHTHEHVVALGYALILGSVLIKIRAPTREHMEVWMHVVGYGLVVSYLCSKVLMLWAFV